MRIWQETTPDGYALVVERDGDSRWVVTVASVSRSRNEALDAALAEAGGGSVPGAWAAKLAAAITHREARAAPNNGRTESAQAVLRMGR
jgi:hypothetical protein